MQAIGQIFDVDNFDHFHTPGEEKTSRQEDFEDPPEVENSGFGDSLVGLAGEKALHKPSSQIQVHNPEYPNSKVLLRITQSAQWKVFFFSLFDYFTFDSVDTFYSAEDLKRF